MMKHLQALVGYCAAALTILAALSFPFVYQGLTNVLAATGVTIAPLYAGGEVAFDLERPGFSIEVGQAVFPGLFGPGDRGFVQLAWTPLENLPEQIAETIDFDRDGDADFFISFAIPPGTDAAVDMVVESRSPWVDSAYRGPQQSFYSLIVRAEDRIFVRIPLTRQEE